jgi:hypothetical protein
MNSGEDGIYCPNFSFFCWHETAHQGHEGDQANLNKGGDRIWDLVVWAEVKVRFKNE